MKDAIMLDSNDVKAIIADHFNVPESESNVVKTQYSYIVAREGDDNAEKKSSNTE